ncbi:MAG: hypothetical protein WEE66_11170 [Actinomycetota bacterium]
MSSSQVGLTILGGLIAGAVGLLLFFVQHWVERKNAKRAATSEALRQLADALMPLLIELDRWRYNPDQSVAWVGSSRQLPSLRTWIFDPEENARKPPDWDSIGRHAQFVERLWRDRLSARAADPVVDAQWSEASKLLFHISLRGGADPRSAAERAEERIIELLETIQKRMD